MRITHVFWSLGFGGIETMLVNIANAQAEAEAQVSVVIINDSCEESLVKSLRSDVNLYVLGRKVGSKGLGFILKLNKVLGELKPDVVHLHRSDLGKLLLRSQFSHKMCVTLHALPLGMVRCGSVWSDLWRKITKQTLVYSNVTYIDRIPCVFAISNAVQKELMDKYSIKSTVVCNGIITSRFAERTDRVPNGILRIVMVSRLEHDKKGQDLLIEAAAKLRDRISIDFIGIGSSMEYLKEFTHKLQLDNQVHFLGKQTQDYVATHLADYDLFVQPSRWEGFGLTVAEAMAARVPVLVSEGQGPAEVTCGNQYGWLFINGDVADLVQRIGYIASHYEEAMVKATEAHCYVRNTYDVSVTAHSYLREYERLKS